jgi:cellulose synthase/poly-beta-1,6-N-acetylglucosamine synthase-like glycosyltransferase
MNWLLLQALLCFLFLLCALFLLFGALKSRARREAPSPPPPAVTIIVVARDEAEQIGGCLCALAGQKYSGPLQVILVDDHSSDGTQDLMATFACGRENWLVLRTPDAGRWRSGKKNGLALATAQATGELLFFTDADCLPSSGWVTKSVVAWPEDTIFLAGFSPLHHVGGRRWDRFLFTTSLADALVTAGLIGWNRGTSCTGRNLAFRSPLLTIIDGYSALPDTISGDDDFVLQAASCQPKWRVAYSFDPDTFVPSPGPADWRSFLQQKRRHLSASRHYPLGRKLFFAFYHGSNLGVWLFTPLFLFHSPWHLFILLFKFIAEGLVLSVWANRLGKRLEWLSFVWWEGLFPLYHLWCLPRAWAGRLSWKNREL